MAFQLKALPSQKMTRTALTVEVSLRRQVVLLTPVMVRGQKVEQSPSEEWRQARVATMGMGYARIVFLMGRPFVYGTQPLIIFPLLQSIYLILYPTQDARSLR